MEGGQTLQAASVEAEAVEFEEPMSMPDMSMMASACEGRVTRRLSGWRWWEEGKWHDETLAGLGVPWSIRGNSETL